MKTLLVILAVLVPALCVNWAVLAAGSNNFYNYRHQADVFHAYQVLLKRGFNADNIIVLAFDDIASAKNNPFPGKIFNKPTYKDPGVDVYQGVKIDYTGKDVTPKVFLNVLLGNQSFVRSKGTGRVLKSGPEDNVFIFFSDHGSPGSISFPTEFLYANDLIQTLTAMQGTFKKLVFYLETCESGSMFVKLPSNISVYALSAASASESSWATYCSPDDVVAGKHLGTCLGDLFSVSFIEDLETATGPQDTLQSQFQRIKARTTESKVMQWGDVSFGDDIIVDIFGNLKRSNGIVNGIRNLVREKKIFQKISTYHVKINFLLNLYKKEKTTQNFKLLHDQMSHMKKMDSVFFYIKELLSLKGVYNGENINQACLKQSVDFFESRCAKLQDYNLQYMKLLAENCQSRSSASIQPIVERYCH